MWNRGAVVRSGIIATLGCAVCSTHLLAQTKTLNRIYDPVVVAAGKLAPLSNASIAGLTAYRYDASSGEFFSIPFQIDEVDPSGNFLRENDGIADSNDVIVFMPGDTGDRAPIEKWVSGSPQNTRIELEVTDPLAPGGKGWVYLFRNVATPPPVDPYVRYDRGPSTTAGTDTVFGKSYVEAHDATGWFTYTAIPPAAGGDGLDILDRQKVRLGGVLFIFPLTLNEEAALQFIGVRYGGGAVRGLRELTSKIVLGADSIATARFVTQYFPHSRVFGAKEAEIPVVPNLTVNHVRASVDFNAHAVGMKFFNAFNTTGFAVDGVPESPANTITDPPDGLNWMMVTGNPGTVLQLLSVPQLGSSRTLYYKDDATVNNEDSGDKKSYGDFGLLVTSTTTISGSFSFDFTTYYLGKNQTVDIGDQFKQRALNPMQVTALEQTGTTTAVKDNRARPAGFALDEAQPNPFWPLRGRVLLGFNSASAAKTPSLRVFNLLGQEVMRFDLSSSSAGGNSSWQQVFWDGRNANGQLLPAGIYFFQLQAGAQVATKKLVILR